MKVVETAITVVALVAFLVSEAGASVHVDEEEVVFRLEATEAKVVYLVGDFNGWNPTIDMMTTDDAGFAIRLFLLPGRYRYMFVVDGHYRHDPDNTYIDESGNSYFILTETQEIAFSERVGGVSPIEEAGAAISGETYVEIDDCIGSVFFRGNIHGTVDNSAEADLAVGYECVLEEGEVAKGNSYLLSGYASYRTDRGTIKAFNRLDCLDQGDPLAIFGSVGPFDYPLGLFCRGVACEGKIVFGAEGRLFYASRIDGYKTGLEEAARTGTGDNGTDLFAERDLTDSDLIGARIGGKLGRLKLDYLFRRDLRPKVGTWTLPGHGDEVYSGFEKVLVSGIWVSLPCDGDFRLDVEYLRGESYLSALKRAPDEAGDFTSFEKDKSWERGYRFYTGVEYGAERFGLRLFLTQTTIEGDRRLREERPDGARTSVGCNLDLGSRRFGCSICGKVESFSESNTGEVFWLQRKNFWLDGEELDVDHLPFLASRGLYEFRVDFRWDKDKDAVFPCSGIHISMLHRGDQTDRSPRLMEILFGMGFPLHTRLTLLVDMRSVFYRHDDWTGERNFLDTFVGLHGRITDSFWSSVGFGVNPHSFDRWIYAFSNHGREDYLLNEGLFEVLDVSSGAELMDAVRDAEKLLSDEWIITFEAGMRF
ncbi:MAG: glycogen-binding domain-containing protein [Candidatus Krumholzibacteria bacterium]|nr:glycogen-binding domain-containing protein [Candidatus Krumholzibacteria bacterium]